jgi:hypothetical protein
VFGAGACGVLPLARSTMSSSPCTDASAPSPLDVPVTNDGLKARRRSAAIVEALTRRLAIPVELDVNHRRAVG